MRAYTQRPIHPGQHFYKKGDSFYSYADENILSGKVYVLDIDRNDVMSALQVGMKEFAVRKEE